MREWMDLLEQYYGTFDVMCDYGEKVSGVEVFRNPSRVEVNKLMAQSEHGSLRACLYTEENDLLLVWIGDRVQHHDLDHAVFGAGERYYIRLFFDATGVSAHASPDDEAFVMEEKEISNSVALRRIFGKDFEVSYA